MRGATGSIPLLRRMRGPDNNNVFPLCGDLAELHMFYDYLDINNLNS